METKMKERVAGCKNKVLLNNKSAVLTVDLFGGAITDFHLHNNPINPLSFAFSKEQMPENNQSGAPYQGHFLCLGRWGEPSAGERHAGMPNHGQMANISWQQNLLPNKDSISMQANSPLEGLKVERMISMDTESALFGVEEKVTNVHSLGRLYNMVQHPTLSSPFLDETTIVRCNATEGFDQFADDHSDKSGLHWPAGRDEKNHLFDLKTPDVPYNSVFSYIVNRQSEYGWICAYNPRNHLMLGYVWKRRDYPWIHLWQHWEGGQIKYRGIEFGTAGIHQPFKKILERGIQIFGEKTAEYIDAGETISRRYISFLFEETQNINNKFNISVKDNGGQIVINHSTEQAFINTRFKNFL